MRFCFDRFRADLKAVAKTIERRNKSRPKQYVYEILIPRDVPNATNS